ncbi:50S ribosomal protein L21 [Microgenomates group bacterium RIFCSPLOWO2_01_FULL_46_13]|nr:MAG: 50S ribosomal protein L21 [Microgenomates group bacterium RIFCSPHIGHO2_01_FULL_45_11]OGV94631.1 MAG: 50S ribosomal protein L21 [Microgenomates group bacterium RIFCSPLOWO2_01_FULL_46_13]
MKYVVVTIAGKQYLVSIGDELMVDRLKEEVGATFSLKRVLLSVDGEKRMIGTPTVNQAVTVTVVEHGSGEKIRIATYKAKSRYRRVKGQRPAMTKLKVVAIKTAAKEATAPKPRLSRKASKTIGI